MSSHRPAPGPWIDRRRERARSMRDLRDAGPVPFERSGWADRDDRASLTVELVVLTPVLLVVVLASLVFGRVVEARQQVVESARAGAEAAAVLPTAGTAQWVGSIDSVVNLLERSHTCARATISVDTSHFVPRGYVTAHVSCLVLLSDVGFPGLPGSTTVSASATAPLDPYRSVG
jgi:TadE-like protein